MEEVSLQTCRDIMVYPLYRHSGICNGVSLLVLHNAPDATMHLDREGNTLRGGQHLASCKFCCYRNRVPF